MPEQINLDKEDLITFFVHHLDKVYSAKSHLLKRLPEILYQVHFSDLEEAVFETIKIVEAQRKRMETIYEMMGTAQNEGRISGLTGLIDDSFEEIKSHQNNLNSGICRFCST